MIQTFGVVTPLPPAHPVPPEDDWTCPTDGHVSTTMADLMEHWKECEVSTSKA